ncbi:hypothetical protein GF312_00695 [Candidatus Poribacteria bacterium]|nr:hypothetical protein [Candidatus Poribacteria bacterium]
MLILLILSFRRNKLLKNLICFAIIILLSISITTFITTAYEIDNSKFMTIDKIEPGMKGIGKTVFEGTKISEFNIEVLAIDYNFNGPKSHIIWVLCSGEPLDETGVMKGMSGSPIYIDGKMIGALAYTYSFSKKPIAGVTPIAQMLEMLDKTDSEGYTMSYLERDEMFPEFISNVDSPSIIPIQTPVMMSGFHPQAINKMSEDLKGFGMVPLQGGSGSSSNGVENISLKPGSVIGIEFVKGDLSAYASGTITHVYRNKILAFGHPMYGLGSANLPMTAGECGLLLPSLMSSSKSAAPLKTVGTITYDSQHGIMGIVNLEPEFIPMNVKIFQDDVQIAEYDYEIAKHKTFSPMYIGSTVESSIYHSFKALGDNTIRIKYKASIKDYPDITQEDVFSGSSPGSVASAFAMPFYALMQNSFTVADIENIELEMSVKNGRINAAIDAVRLNKEEVKPGGSVEVSVFLRPYMGESFVKRIPVKIPKDAPEGLSILRISSASSSVAWNKARAPMKSQIKDMDHLIRVIQEEISNDNIVIELFVPKIGVTVGDQELPALPLSTFRVIDSQMNAGENAFTRGTTFMKESVKTEYVISGSATLLLEIDRNAR